MYGALPIMRLFVDTVSWFSPGSAVRWACRYYNGSHFTEEAKAPRVSDLPTLSSVSVCLELRLEPCSLVPAPGLTQNLSGQLGEPDPQRPGCHCRRGRRTWVTFGSIFFSLLESQQKKIFKTLQTKRTCLFWNGCCVNGHFQGISSSESWSESHKYGVEWKKIL